ncbi:MAG: RecQ family ATP-dependent DNA helicase [Paludibacteraceae bacterium]|nr:RecQ family ATP-dependent DNA helicase [Paludibacteraceae bacterium]
MTAADQQLYDILRRTWGYTEFRPLQLDIIRSIMSGKDTLGLMPTGGGKSLTFQVPALAMEGLCIVITPLIALMKDQVANLRKIGVKATAIYMGMTSRMINQQLDNCIFGDYRFLYLSPERLNTQLFRQKLRDMNVKLLVVDEAHCISQWGYDFRPAYLQIGQIRDAFPNVPVLALTATATSRVVANIQKQLRFKAENVLKSSFRRPNLTYSIQSTEDKGTELLRLLNKHSGTAIVYVRNRQLTKQIADYLISHGINALPYHAGMKSEQRTKNQTLWTSGETRVIVATNAFGMGIDKPDVRLVIHWTMPNTLEEYFQEAGRAGRDGKMAYAVVIFDAHHDLPTIKARLKNNFPQKDFIAQVYDDLCHNYSIAVGTGQDAAFAFDITDFCIKRHLPPLQTYAALHILELSGYITLSEEVNIPTRVQVLTERDQLYDVQLPATQDRVLQDILRTTTGVFADLAPIDETRIAQHIGTTPQIVAESLLALSRQYIIKYVPHRQTPYVSFNQIRVSKDDVFITRAAYEDRQKNFEEGINAVMHYVTQDAVCRSQVLVRYFGEHDSKPCGHCDVCLQNEPQQPDGGTFTAIRHSVIEILADKKPHLARTVADQIPQYDRGLVNETLRIMLDNGDITLQGEYICSNKS